MCRILLVISFQEQDHAWRKDLNFSSGMFLEIGYWSKMFDWHFFFISKQLLVQSLHDQDQIWWKVSNFSSETFLEKVDLSKIVNLAWTVLTLAWTYQKQIDLLSQDLFSFEDILRKRCFYQDCPLNYEKNWQYKIYWSSGVNWPWMARNHNLIMAWNWRWIPSI